MKSWFIKSDNGLTKDNFKYNKEFSYIIAQLLANRNVKYTDKIFLYPNFIIFTILFNERY